MREMGIAGICPGPNLSKRRLDHQVYPYLLRGLEICRPNQVWGIDITYIPMRSHWIYLVAIIDWYSRYIEILKAREVRISMDGRGRALDNVFTERLWRSLKYEEVYPNEYCSPREARNGIGRYLRFYNEERPHQSLDYRTPIEVYRS
jgi:putative transposase